MIYLRKCEANDCDKYEVWFSHQVSHPPWPGYPPSSHPPQPDPLDCPCPSNLTCYQLLLCSVYKLVMMIMAGVHIMPIQMAPFWHFDYKQLLILVIPVEAKMQRSSWSNQSIFGFQSISTFSINLGLERKISWVWTPASQADHMHHNFFISNFMIKLSSPPSRPRFKSL